MAAHPDVLIDGALAGSPGKRLVTMSDQRHKRQHPQRLRSRPDSTCVNGRRQYQHVIGRHAANLRRLDLLVAALGRLNEFTATPVRQQAVHSRMMASASSGVTALRLLNLMKSSREVMTCGASTR
jgi:hypothetical protein